MKKDNDKNENKGKKAANTKKISKKKTAGTSTAKKRSSAARNPARRAKKCSFKKLPDFSAELCKELTPPKTETLKETIDIQCSEPAPYLDDKFSDEKYISHRKVGNYYYSIYIKPCQPEMRDALLFLNSSTNKETPRPIIPEVSVVDESRLKSASDELLSYIYKKCGLLRLFFSRVRSNYPITSIIIRPIMFWEDVTLEKVIEVINWNSNKDLFCVLLSQLHESISLPMDILQHAMKDREHFYTYMDGASYSPANKDDLIALYESCDFNDPDKPSLKEMLFEFLEDYYREYKIRFECIRDIVAKEQEYMKCQIEKYGDLPWITNHFLFRKMIMVGGKEKAVCLEKLAFSRGNVEYFTTRSCCVICVGHGSSISPGSVNDYERLGDKLKNFTDDATSEILRLLSRRSANIEKIMEVTQMNKDSAYRLTNILIEQQILIKNDETNEFVLNKEHLRKIIKLLEKYGGIEL